MPILHLARLVWALRNRPRLWPSLFAALPVTLAVFTYSPYQEAPGYLSGPESSRGDFLTMELSVGRGR